MVTVGSILEFIASPVTVLDSVYSTRHEFTPIVWALSPIRWLLAIPKIKVPVLNLMGFLRVLVTTMVAVYRVYSRAEITISFLCHLVQLFLVIKELFLKEEMFSHNLIPPSPGFQIYTVFSKRDLFQFLECDQRQWQYPIFFLRVYESQLDQ